ncbi:hypothetical protein D3C77_519140 [compost metagenome]
MNSQIFKLLWTMLPWHLHTMKKGWIRGQPPIHPFFSVHAIRLLLFKSGKVFTFAGGSVLGSIFISFLLHLELQILDGNRINMHLALMQIK